MIYLHVAICAGLVGLGYWRVMKANSETARGVRLSLSLLTTASLGMLLAPLAWGQTITGAVLFFEAALLFHQATTARLWRDGPPGMLQKA